MLYQKMQAVMADVNAQVAEREELVEAIAVALLTRKNLFILGDTGQAKSYAINLFRSRITGTRQFERLLSKQCDEEQLFGRIDLATLIPGNPDADVLAADPAYRKALEDLQSAYQNYLAELDSDEMKRGDALTWTNMALRHLESCKHMAYALHGNQPKIITTGKIPDSHIVFLDEVFKANDGVLNSLLTALNERRYTNEGQTTDIPTISFFGASNEIPDFNNPEDKILKPLYDRFDLKLVTRYVESRDARLSVLKDKQSAASTGAGAAITLDELRAMQAEVASVAVPDAINELMDDVLCELREKGIHISDRKYFSYYPLAQAKAWLESRDTVEPSDLVFLQHYLWTAPEQRETIAGVLIRMCSDPLKDKLDRIVSMAREALEDFEQSADVPNPRRLGKLRNELVTLYQDVEELRSAAQSDAERGRIETAVAEVETVSQKAHTAAGMTYAPLSELYEISKVS